MYEAIFIAFLVAPGVTLLLWHTPWDLKIIIVMEFGIMSIFIFQKDVIDEAVK